MKLAAHAKTRFLSLFSVLVLSSLAMPGCRWHDDEYKKYVGPDGKVTPCKGYKVLSLGMGRYIKKNDDGSFICGDYNKVVIEGIEGQKLNRTNDDFLQMKDAEYLFSDCSEEEIKTADEAMNHGVCTSVSHNCETMLGKGGRPLTENDIEQKMCSEHGEGRIGCHGKASKLIDDDEHCGFCDEVCNSDTPYCINGECSKIECSYTVCGNECVDTTQDNNFCGNCETSCNNETQKCANGNCVPKTCVDSCTREELIDFVISEEEFTAMFMDAKSVCIDPGDPSMCGITTCLELKTRLSNKQKLGCEGELICLQNVEDANKYSCSCPNGTFKHETLCLTPSDNRSCGATATSRGKQCTTETGYCDPENHTCSLCVGGKIACSTGDDANPVTKCIDPETSKEFCGANLTCDNYMICNGENSECVGGQCQCESGYAACGTENKGEVCKKLTDEDMMMNHCGAKSGGQCNSDDSESADYMGMSCENVDKTTCVVNEETTYCGCPISVDNNYITCDDKCIFSRSDVHYCGATDCEENRGVDCIEQIISNGFELSCSIGQCKCDRGTASIVSDHPDFVGSVCVDTLTDPKCCTEPGGVCQGNNCLEREGNMTCKDGTCTELTCEADELYCDGKCVYDMIDCTSCSAGKCPVYEHGIIIGCGFPIQDNNCGSCGNVCKNGTKCVVNSSTGKTACECQRTYFCKQEFNNDTDGVSYCVDRLPDNVRLEENNCYCKQGFADLDGNFDNGCEIDLNNDKNNCGTIGNDCAKLPHVVNPQCKNGICSYDRCESRFASCDNDSEDGVLGCEADLTKPATCGTCSHKCNENSVCNPDNYECCYQSGVIFSHSLDVCCDSSASVWRQCVGPACLMNKKNWQCSVNKPSGYWELAE